MFNKLKRMKPVKQTLFAVIIAFAVISFWRGVWGLMDEYLFPSNHQVSFWASLFIGLIILVGTHYAVKELT